MNEERLRRRIEQFRRALARLKHAAAQAEDEFIRDAVIQRFEFCFELAWKMLKLKLELEGIEATTPRQVIREAVTARMLEDGNRWSELLRMRNETSHTYDEALARRVYRFILDEGLDLLRRLSEEAGRW